MSEPHTKPETWAEASGGWTEEFFKMRLYQTDSIPHLKEALEYEKDTRNRGSRLSAITEQLRKTVESADTFELKEAIEKEAGKDDPDKGFIGQLNKELQDRK